MTVTIVQPRHMAGFACLGPDCPDTCCKDWAVDVDPPTARLWRRHPDPVWRARFEAGLRRVRDGKGEARALVAMRADGSCPFHGEDRLCTIQKELGASAMPWICRVFPRGEEREGDLLARTGSLACVAVARAAIGEADALDETVEGSIGPTLLGFGAPDAGERFALRERLAVRRTVFAILRRSGWSWPARLVLFALFVEELGRLELHRDRASLLALLDRFAAVLRLAEPEGVADALAPARARAPLLLVPVLRALLEATRVPVPGKVAWGAFVAAALDRLGIREAAPEEAAERLLALASAHLEPLSAAMPHLFPNLAAALAHQLRFPGERPNDVLDRFAALVVAFATWRLLFVARLAAGVADPREAAAEVAWRLGRHLLHSRALVERGIEGLARAGARAPAALVALAV
ncbi:MAG: flagellin lysine-N-methylase [Geminicoccaceae bacterium]|nr:flagellin lysine-N-methylase [Geminicoccaceae bacterium]